MMSSVAWGRKSETGTFLRFAKSGVAVCIIGCALTVPARAATKVAVIDGGSPVPPTEGQHWCGFLNDNGYECTLFPRSGPTETLDPFQVIIDMSDEWSDPTGSLADQMRARKGVITWGSAPGALGLSSNPWIGANDNVNSCDDLVTLVRDPILGSIPPGIAVAFCGDGPCWSLLDTIGHPDAKILATFPSYCYGIGILRNTWEGGQSVYLFGHITPGNAPPLHDDIILSTMRTLSRPIP
ncbi:MAG: hypothetical protein Q7R41_01550, partial [Phycisphaerales bacterium]|nr:hypothetical protein [Phycisphaerales bacterium]